MKNLFLFKKLLLLVFVLTFTSFLFVGCGEDGSTDCELFDDCGTNNGGGGGSGTCYYTQYNGVNNCINAGYYPVSSTSCCAYDYPYYNTYTDKCYASCSAARNASSSGSVYKANIVSGGGTCYYTQWTGTTNCVDAGYYPVYSGTCCSYSYPYYNTYTGNCYTSCESARNASSSGSIYRINTSYYKEVPSVKVGEKMKEHISATNTKALK